MAMKLDQALKLYIALYVICFALTWLISVPMLMHVTPRSECLLFVSRYVTYGNSIVCNLVGILPLLVALASLVLILLHAMQLRALYAFLRKRTPHSSDHHNRPTHIFWRMVMFHSGVTLVVLVIAAIVTAGYAETCQNLHDEVKRVVRSRVTADLYGGGVGNRENYDRFANDRSIDRYTNSNRDQYGRNTYDRSITCRSVLTDPEMHSQLKQNHAENPNFRNYYGFWYGDDVADVGNIHYLTYRDNLILELCMSGAWLSFVVWIAILILMLKERHHLKAHLYDESVLGSEFGGSRRSASRMSNQSFDKMSQSRYSNYSGSQMSGSRRGGSGYGSRRNQQMMSPNGSYQKGPAPPRSNGHQFPSHQNSLVDYFARNPPVEEEVDVDAALAEQDLTNSLQMSQERPRQSYIPEVDATDFNPNDVSAFNQSFELPVVDTTLGANEPIALGDEVSAGNSLQATPLPDQYQQQPLRYDSQTGAPRQTGRRANRFQTPQQMEAPPPQEPYYPEYSPEPLPEPTVAVPEYRPPQQQQYQPEPYPQQQYQPQPQQPVLQTPRTPNSYRTRLGNQSMI